jgi:glycosyltransferase involved in cell wall biosynthesis
MRLLLRAVWLLRVAAVGCGGAAVRMARRMCRCPPRIWHGFMPLHMTEEQVRADRLAGYPSRSVVKHSQPAPYAIVADANFDRVVKSIGVRWNDAHWVCLLDLLRNGDVWVANFDCHFFRVDQVWLNRQVFRLLRIVGIKTIAAPHGGDINYHSRFASRYDWTARYKQDYPQWDGHEQRETAQRRITLFCDWAHLVLGADSSLARVLPRNDLLFKYFPVDCEKLQPAAPATNIRPVIAHAPNHRLTKGTDFLFQSIENLRGRGVEVELMLVEGVPREEALYRYREADIIADQFCIGAFGMFALEGLALGKPVLTYLDQEHLGDPVFNLPLVNTNPDNVERVLAVLLQVPDVRERLGKAGRASVEQYQSVPALAEVWDRIYRHVWWGEPLNLETTKHFSSERKARSFTEDPSRADFWPVPVDDLLPEIHAALDRAGFSGGATSGKLPVDANGVELSAPLRAIPQ